MPRVLRILTQKALLILDSLINCLTFQKHSRDDPAMTSLKGTVKLVQHAPTLHMPKHPHSRDALAYLLLLRSLNRDFAPALKQHLTVFSKTCRSHQQQTSYLGTPRGPCCRSAQGFCIPDSQCWKQLHSPHRLCLLSSHDLGPFLFFFRFYSF